MEKAAVFAVGSALLAVMLKQIGSQMTHYVVLFSTVGLFGYLLLKLTGVFEMLEQLTTYFSIDELYLSTLFKIVGIACLGEFTGNVCSDLGYSGMASQIQLIARLAILSLSLPIVLTLLGTLEGMFVS